MCPSLLDIVGHRTVLVNLVLYHISNLSFPSFDMKVAA